MSSHLVSRFSRLFGFAVAASGLASLAPTARADEDPVRLPPFLVEVERQGGPNWLFAETDGLEVLSAGDEQDTATFLRNFLRYRRALQEFVPDSLLAKTALPTTLILFPEHLLRGLDKDTARLLASAPAKANQGRFETMNDLRLADPDSSYIFVALKESGPTFRFRSHIGPPVVFSEESLRFLIQSRVPAPPDWFSVGMSRLYAANLFPELEADVAAPSVGNDKLVSGFEPDRWVSTDASARLRDDPDASRPMLPLRELLVPLAPRDRSAEYQRVWAAQAELFVRWAFAGNGGPGRERLWHLADDASRRPMTESVFRTDIGESFADTRDTLSDFLPRAVSAPTPVPNRVIGSPPSIVIREATPVEIRRIKGEWARRCLALVATNYPGARPAYEEKTRQILERSLQSADRNPQPLASLALFYIDEGELPHARQLFAQHPEIVHARPLVALAHVRLEAADCLGEGPVADPSAREQDVAKLFTELAGLSHEWPPLEASYVLASRILQRMGRDPNPEERAFISDGAVQFPRNAVLAILAAAWDLRAGDVDRAQRIVELALPVSSDPAAREKLTALYQLTLESHTTTSTERAK